VRSPEPHNKPTAGDADVISTVRGGWGNGAFDNLKSRLRAPLSGKTI